MVIYMPNYPHLSDSNFPDINTVDVYKYVDNLDYQRFNSDQMRIRVCSVPWDLGEAHIGNRVLEGVGNVVEFDNENARNNYFDSDNSGYVFNTKYRRFHSDDKIVLPLSIYDMGDYNYIEVTYFLEPNSEVPLEYANNTISRWYYFIRSCNRKGSNSTECVLMLDAWQTFIYRVEIPYLFLERGHYPLTQISVDDYLNNPCNNNEWLLTEDVVLGEIGQVASTSAVQLNKNVSWACFCVTSNPTTDWGTVGADSWRCTAAAIHIKQGAPSGYVFAVATSELSDFLEDVDVLVPQFKQSVQGVFFIDDKLITLGNSFNFADHTCYIVSAKNQELTLLDLDKSDFNYPNQYADLAKLYTFPYAALDIYSESGDVTRINIENTSGKIVLNTSLSLIYPYITIDGHLSGIGGNEGFNTLNFSNVTEHSFNYSGMWYQTLKKWDVPTYAVIQSANRDNFRTYWDREQQQIAADNTLSGTTSLAAAQQANETASANLLVTNAGAQTSANSAINATSNAASSRDLSYGNGLNQALQAWNAGYSRATTAAEIEAQQLQASISSAAGVVGSAASGAMSGATAGPVGAIAGAVGGLVSGGISAATTMANTAISANLSSEKTELTISNTQSQVSETNKCNSDKNSNQISANTSNTNSTNSCISATAANSAAVGIANANRTYNATIANANANYNTAISAITNQQLQYKLGAPLQYGNVSGEYGVTRPMAMFASVVTQSQSAIAQTGDQFLRYGYRCNKAINFTRFAIMPKFTYWQAADIWLRSTTIPDVYMDQLRLLLFGGVTVWNNPDDIGNTSIYENR